MNKNKKKPVHKGYWLKFEGGHEVKGIKSLAEAEYLIDRYYKDRPFALYVNETRIRRNEAMGVMNAYNEANGETGGEFLPFLDGTDKKTGKEGPGKDFLVRTKLPFWIRSTRIRESSNDLYPDQILYEIMFADTPDWEKYNLVIQLERGYTLGLSADQAWRVAQLNDVIKPHFEGKEENLLILKKSGRAYSFADYEG